MERNENGLSALFEGDRATREGCSMGGCARCSQRQLAMVYSPMQCFRMLYDHENALINGTLFEELNKPYEVWR